MDTATAACSVAAWHDGVIVARRLSAMSRGHAEALMPMVAAVVAESGLGFRDFELIAVTVGPGAFTGMRVGLAAARGMALAAGTPCFGVTTLEAVAEAVPRQRDDERPLLVALDTRRADVFAQLFRSDNTPLSSPTVLGEQALASFVPTQPIVIAGDAADRVAAWLRSAGVHAPQAQGPGHPDAAAVAVVAARRWRPGVAAAPPRPLYLRPPEATPQPTARRRAAPAS